jgi:hypothetical protein
MTMTPERMRLAGAPPIGDFFAVVAQQGRLDAILLQQAAPTDNPRLPLTRRDDGVHRPYGLTVLQIKTNRISTIFGFPVPDCSSNAVWRANKRLPAMNAARVRLSRVTPMAMATAQASFGPELFSFLADLRANNNREWFAANKHRCEEDMLDPALASSSSRPPHRG